jgi:hypothetical protein
MGIFRAGKRVGPFDIRVGFPRDRSLDQVDKDPRLKQRANRENTIGRMQANIARSEGYARAARFAIKLFFPTQLKDLIKEQEVDDEQGFGIINSTNAFSMAQLSKDMGQQINLNCDSVTMPSHDLQTQSVQYGSEPASDVVTGHAFAGTINASFYADKYLRERQILEMWQKMAVNMVNHKANYYDEYIGKMHIYQLGSLDGQGDRDVPTYGIEATEVYPATVAAIDYSYAASNTLVKINVAFNYKQWFNLTTDSIAGFQFGESRQKIHDVKSVDRGLFGKLPPELQRAGRDIFNTARRNLPTGRIFKGKIFPPFT